VHLGSLWWSSITDSARTVSPRFMQVLLLYDATDRDRVIRVQSSGDTSKRGTHPRCKHTVSTLLVHLMTPRTFLNSAPTITYHSPLALFFLEHYSNLPTAKVNPRYTLHRQWQLPTVSFLFRTNLANHFPIMPASRIYGRRNGRSLSVTTFLAVGCASYPTEQ